MTSDTDPRSRDKASIYGRYTKPERHVPIVVVGSGAAGTAAAAEAARAGVEVLLIDENPIDLGMMSLDVPLFFGQRMLTTVQNRSSMFQRVVLSNEGLADAEEAGVELLLGHYVWGAFRNSANVRELEGPMVGVADDDRTWCISYDRLIVASGARDMGMAFTGWDKAGVMGANGAWSLINRYSALTTQRMVVVGSGELGLKTAEAALANGVEVAAVVEVEDHVLGSAELRRKLEESGVEIHTSHTILNAEGSADEVEGVRIVQVDAELKPVPDSEKSLECDTIVLAIGLVPNVELLALLGADIPFRSEHGGYAVAVDEWMRTSAPNVYAAGDVAGWHAAMALDEQTAAQQGRLAGVAAAESLGAASADQARERRAELDSQNGGSPSPIHGHYRKWLHSLINADGWGAYTCLCEEVTRGELRDVQPPRYLEWESDQMSSRSLTTLLEDGPVNQDQIKRLTRAGMGYCQGRRCREQVSMLLAEEAGIDVSQVPMPTYRPPVRPLPLRIMSAEDEDEDTRENWTGWFGMERMFRSGVGGLSPPPGRARRRWRTVR